MTIRELQRDIYKTAVEHGWWEEDRRVPELLCLVHSEVSEALEAYRVNGTDTLVGFYQPTEKPEGLFVELADAIIRILDMSERYGVDMGHLVELKHEYNKTREYRHGGKRC